MLPIMPGDSALRIASCLVAACLLGSSCGPAPAPAGERTTAKPASAAPRVLAVGDPAPDFTLPGTDGKQHSLASYRGRQMVVLAWFAKAFTEG